MNKHIPKLLAYMVVIGFLSSIIFWPPVIKWLPERISQEGKDIDVIMWAMVILSIVILAIVMALVMYSIRHFKAVPGEDIDGPPNHGHMPTEIVWIVIPTIIVVVISIWSGVILANAEETPPAGSSIDIGVDAYQFGWNFDYPKYSIKGAANLVMPIGKTAMFKIKARGGDLEAIESGKPKPDEESDVIHSFWVPEARLKEDAVPGYTTDTQWTPNKITLGVNSDGKKFWHKIDVVCAELCGSGHNAMRTHVCIVSEKAFTAWTKEPTKTCDDLYKELNA